MRNLLFAFYLLLLCPFLSYSQNLELQFEESTNELFAPALLNLQVNVEGVVEGEPAYLRVINNETGYRKLKFSNNATSIYNPKINVIYGGNYELKITLKDPNGNINWSKMKLRPEASGSLVLASYVNEVDGIGDEWKTITIPLADFDDAIDFSSISYMEFPYSADAGAFELYISKVEFTGGTNPYLWFGDDKTNNFHDGSGAAYQMDANVIPAVPVDNNVEKVEVYVNNQLIDNDESIPFQFTLDIQDTGWQNIQAKACFNDGSFSFSDIETIYLQYLAPPDLSCYLLQPIDYSEFEAQESFQLLVQTDGATLNEPTYLRVSNTNTGYRKLKMGYDNTNVYGPAQNVIASGNTHLEITLRAQNGFNNWSKIRIRPSAQGVLNLSDYATSVGGINDEWVTISIPLEDFTSSIDFSRLQIFEFPYSADAGFFDIDIQKMEFTGGTESFLWFGESKTDNKHDGLGGGGQLLANLVESNITEETLEKVEFYHNEILIAEDLFSPFKMEYSIEDTGYHSIHAKAYLFNGQGAETAVHQIHIEAPANPISPVQIEIVSPNSLDSGLINEVIHIIPQYTGIDLESITYLKIWNTETGYRKLKLGYDDQYIYSGHANVIAGGNDTLEITLKAFSSNILWNRIRIRPAAIGLLTLDRYLNEYPEDWTTIKIPLADFDAAINFEDLSFIELPYSADAGAFNIGIKSIKFVGGADEFIWFNEQKNDNAHDGTGDGGKVFAELFEPDPNAVSISQTSIYVDGQLEQTVSGPANDFLLTFNNEGLYNISIETMDTDSLIALSDTISFKVYDNDWSGYSRIIVEFAGIPTSLDINKAALKYNKNFAYSLTLDDGKYDGYDYGFKLFNGGYIEEVDTQSEGLYYTDGCGNDINFTAGIDLNSVNSSFTDLHINTPDYMTWAEITEVNNAGWNIYNHSYSHAAWGETDHQFQVEENNNYVFSKTGIEMRHFVIPSGDLAYSDVAFNNGMLAVYSNKVEFSGYPSGIDIDETFNTHQLQIYRRFLNDDNYDISNISERIDQIANSTNENNHIWYSEFTHRIRNQVTGGSLIWPTFEFYMNDIANKYGKNGLDNIWFADMEDVLDYLMVREGTELNFILDGNIAYIYLDFSEIPANLPQYNLSINIDSDVEILNITPEFNSEFNTNLATGLINLNLELNVMKEMEFTNIEDLEMDLTHSDFSIYPNPISNHQFNILSQTKTEDAVQLKLTNMYGQIVLLENLGKMHELDELNIDLRTSNIGSGVYILELISGNRILMMDKIEVQ
ncbi:T9SS type A sorting domain-containing protein [Lentimicrobium sp. L6]|uniref:T9SS type A sorting domain-containing protein n=1 Tax=Lentimicrobium sp. L6 TaxID=2735916 RepID=UPI001555E637|nr:T9SS type A sorting domain-containing protein [Lentimicrobium sp. L6]NPD83248.1 T9SS type A sorting domain-containing protein [Lentimicrobium sp. L6]